MRGATLGNYASATSMYGPRGTTASSPDEIAPVAADEISQAAEMGKRGNPIIALLALGVMVGLLMWGSHKLGTDEDFKNIRLSSFNILTIGWVAIIGLTVWKFVFTKIKVPGLSTIVLAA